MNKILRLLAATLAVLVTLAAATVLGVLLSMRATMPDAPSGLAATVVRRAVAHYDRNKPTVVILLGNSQSELTDVLGPYALFAQSGAYNVYTVASSPALRTLTGGLDVVPQFSFEELQTQLHGTPDIIVLPAIMGIEAPDNKPVLTWLREQGTSHKGTQQKRPLIFSWCTGAEVLAASGLLDGQAATAHWGDLGRLERAYPAVHWQRGVRYIHSGSLLTTAGLTSGIDATLHLLKRLQGESKAKEVARALHIPWSRWVEKPQMHPYRFEASDSIFVFNSAFYWPKRRAGVWLYDGVGELDLAAVFDTYPASGTHQAYSVAAAPAVVSQHGLQFVPRWSAQTLPSLDRVLVPGGHSVEQTGQPLPPGLGGVGVPITHLQKPRSPAFPFQAALEDLAREQDLPTAAFAAKRLEYRTGSLQLTGSQWPLQQWSLHLLLIPLLVGGLTLGGLAWMDRRLRRWLRQRRQRRHSGLATRGGSQSVA